VALDFHLQQLHRYAPDGLDYLLLGIGENGHLICAEPGSSREEEITFCPLHETTAAGAAASFYNREAVPIYWGGFSLKTIMKAKRVDAMILGEKKAKTLAKIVLGEDTEEAPASILRHHKNAAILSDVAAIAMLPEIQESHRFKNSPQHLVDWNSQFCRERAITQASLNSGTALSRLKPNHFEDIGITSLESSPTELCLSVIDCYEKITSRDPEQYFYPGIKPKDAPAINL